jgi:aquaporin Z
MKKLLAEFLGTFVLVLFGCGSAVLAGQAIGNLGISMAFGIGVIAMAYAVGGISGGHFNPAVTVGLCCAKRFGAREVVPYILSQLLGAISAAAVIYAIASGLDGFVAPGVFAANGYASYGLVAAFVAELVFTFVFLMVILGSTDKAPGFAPLAIGLALTAIHLVSIPITNTSVNPARSTSQALLSSVPAATEQLWLFWAAPMLGAILAGFAWHAIFGQNHQNGNQHHRHRHRR